MVKLYTKSVQINRKHNPCSLTYNTWFCIHPMIIMHPLQGCIRGNSFAMTSTDQASLLMAVILLYQQAHSIYFNHSILSTSIIMALNRPHTYHCVNKALCTNNSPMKSFSTVLVYFLYGNSISLFSILHFKLLNGSSSNEKVLCKI